MELEMNNLKMDQNKLFYRFKNKSPGFWHLFVKQNRNINQLMQNIYIYIGRYIGQQLAVDSNIC